MNSLHVTDQLPGYVLETLDSNERRETANHLSLCPSCRQDLARYQDSMDLLAEAIPMQETSSDLRSKVLMRVHEAARRRQNPLPAQSSWTRFATAIQQFLAKPTGMAVFGSTIVLLIVLLLNTIQLNQQLSSLQARLPSNDIRIVQFSGTDRAPGSSGYLMIFNNETAGVLAIHDAPLLDPGFQYQVWMVKDGVRTNGGVFSVNTRGYGSLQIEANQPLGNFQSIGITIEPAGGSLTPTGAKVMGGTL